MGEETEKAGRDRSSGTLYTMLKDLDLVLAHDGPEEF